MYTRTFSEVGKDDVRQVGGKAASLGELFRAKFPVPLGFVITADAFKDLANKDFPASFIKEVMNQFDLIDATRVSVRSSALAEDSADNSWAGQMETYLNVEKDSLLDRIKDCWDSVSSERARVYAERNAANSEDLAMAVVIQKMVDSEVAGVMFTANPVNGNKEELLIEAGYGLGEGIVSGVITPDSFMLNKDSLEITSHSINEQSVKIAYVDGQTKTVDVSPEERTKQKLSDEAIKSLTKLGIKIENYYGSPQDIEWAFSEGELYILQSRPITTLDSTWDDDEGVDIKPITKGIGASRGITTGRVRVILEVQDLKKVKDGEILVTQTTTPDFVEVFPKIRGIVTDTGGVTNHAAVVSREMGVPAVVGTKNITQLVRTGDVITIDGFRGLVYEGDVKLKDFHKKTNFKVPAPSGDDIEDMAVAIAAVINNSNELWPLAPLQLMPYIETDQSVDMFKKVTQLKNDGKSDEFIAALFERPIFIKNFLLNTGIIGMKSANIFEKRVTLKDQVDFVSIMLNLAKILNHNDPNFITSRNLLWDESEVSKFVRNAGWQEITPDFAGAINVLSVNLLALNWSLYWNYFAETGHELHGPYKVNGFTPNSRMVVKDYYNLSSSEVWPHGKDFPYNEIRLAQIYSVDTMYLSFGIRMSGDVSASDNTHFALFVDGERVTDLGKIQQISSEAKQMADKQTKFVNALEPMEKVRKGAKISYFARKKFYSYFNDQWYPEAMVEGTIKALGNKFIDDTTKPKPMSLEQKRLVWDPRNTVYPGLMN